MSLNILKYSWNSILNDFVEEKQTIKIYLHSLLLVSMNMNVIYASELVQFKCPIFGQDENNNSQIV